MAQQYNNPFLNMSVVSLATQRHHYDRYCQAGQKHIVDMSPFPRKVDFWFAALALAARKNLKPIDLTKEKTVNIISGDIFNTDGWQAQAIMLIATAVKGDLKIVLEPSQMMKIANGLAAAGVPHIVKMLDAGPSKPRWNLSDELAELLQSDAVTEVKSDHQRLAEALR